MMGVRTRGAAPETASLPLVDFLVASGRLDAVQRDRVLALRRERGESEGLIVTRLGMVGERDMAECLSEFLAIPLAGTADFPDAPLVGELGRDFIARAQVLPIADAADSVALAMADPTD